MILYSKQFIYLENDTISGELPKIKRDFYSIISSHNLGNKSQSENGNINKNDSCNPKIFIRLN